MTDRVLDMAVAGGTVLLAAVTAVLAWDTHRLAQSQTADEHLRRTTIVLRECATATSADARGGESLIDLVPSERDGYVSNDRLSPDEFPQFMKSKANDYLRCEIINASQLPVLNVQVALSVDMPRRPTVRVISSAFHVIEAGSRRIIWFTNNTATKVVIHSPDRVRYTAYVEDGENEPLEVRQLRPSLDDRWTVTKDAPIQENLDQREMRSF